MTVRSSTGLALPALEGGAPLLQVVATAIKRRRGAASAGAAGHAHWDARFFGLDRATLFAGASAAEQAAILERCGRGLLAEAYYIEKAGMAFAARMLLLAQSSDERKLYALFAADEATHFDGVAQFYADPAADDPAANPFLALLAALIDEGDRQSLQLVIQVVLEGWGLSHYRSLRDGCADPSLRVLLSAILADEAAHHGSGVVLLADAPLTAPARTLSFEVLSQFLALVQPGPLGIVAAVEAVRGPLAAAARAELVAELDAERHAATRLGELRALLAKIPAAAELVARLERDGRFRPLCHAEPVS